MIVKKFALLLVVTLTAAIQVGCSQPSKPATSPTDEDSLDITKTAIIKDTLMVIDTIAGLKIYYPRYTSVDLAFKNMPSVKDSSVIIVCEAAFTGQLLNEFEHRNIAGNHVSSGKMYRGYSCRANTGCFAWYADSKTWEFAMGSYSPLLAKAESCGGMAFGQAMVVYNGKIQEKQPQKLTSKNEYRALAEYKGKLTIIDSNGVMVFKDFTETLRRIGVKHALYLDMGAGWNFSWYRDNDGKVNYIHDKRIRYTTNWITFRK